MPHFTSISETHSRTMSQDLICLKLAERIMKAAVCTGRVKVLKSVSKISPFCSVLIHCRLVHCSLLLNTYTFFTIQIYGFNYMASVIFCFIIVSKSNENTISNNALLHLSLLPIHTMFLTLCSSSIIPPEHLNP